MKKFKDFIKPFFLMVQLIFYFYTKNIIQYIILLCGINIGGRKIEMNEMVYALYDLSATEIKLIEEQNG